MMDTLGEGSQQILEGWLAGTPADRYQEGKQNATQAVLGRVWWGYGLWLLASLEEILGNHQTPKTGKVVLRQLCLKWQLSAAHHDWGYIPVVERILWRFSQPNWYAFHIGGRGRGEWGRLDNNWDWSCWTSLRTLWRWWLGSAPTSLWPCMLLGCLGWHTSVTVGVFQLQEDPTSQAPWGWYICNTFIFSYCYSLTNSGH